MSLSLKKGIAYALLITGTILCINLFIRTWLLIAAAGYPFPMVLLYAFFVILLSVQFLGVWYLYSRFRVSQIPDAPLNLSVDVFVTAYNEPLALIERSLKAAKDIRYPHRTYLLDDSPNGRYQELAERLDCEHLTRQGNIDYKAGNINAALKNTSGDFVVIFDADHAPEPQFLDRTLGFFKDQRVGFVQVMETFANGRENVIAQASAQTAMEYFNITAVCKDSVGATSLHGTNAVIRRTALDSIGGYCPGLAEDLETSLALHGHGWKSACVAEPLAPGLTPASFTSFCKQQLKWSSGVFEAALRAFLNGTFRRLTWHQKIAYSVRFSYYLIGLSFFIGMTLTFLNLILPLGSGFENFLSAFLPLSMLTLLIRWYMLRQWAIEPEARKGLQFKGASLILCTWPIYLVSLLCMLVRIRIPFISTPKHAKSGTKPWLIVPQLVMIMALIVGIIWKLLHWQLDPAPLTLLFAMLLVLQQWILLVPIWQNLSNPVIIEGAGIRRRSIL